MNYNLLHDVMDLIQEFEISNEGRYEHSVDGFKNWISASNQHTDSEPDWEGKENGRSAESFINTLIVHMNRYAKSYSKSAILGSDFSTQEDFIYLINLKVFGEMTKMELIKKNVHEKPVGMQIINRLIAQGWIEQSNSIIDKRSKVISITSKGLAALENQMGKIRKATEIVTGDLTHGEKMELIRLLHKLNDFHQPIYEQNIETEYLLEEALKFKN
ncbi:MarR family winged helix-turn-helix transcriptional regulator [Myroides odoratimimus]|uniref:MarR family winged helix-turn-helix transcriptional regulator n=1 Tax=Myroides odoratimimus TaxID=76832 RepID=UPI002577CEDF|nr:helix-turn-helix domain-containing protein [Myroides odoratimimus]MDM1328807.1 winged helix-turn-helix transcriptional regulator [Myroides odoratimimus]